MDARTGKVVHAVNADTRRAPGLADQDDDALHRLRRGPARAAVARPEGHHLRPTPPPSRRRGSGCGAGQRIELRYLIRAAAIKSANDAATALGEAVAGSEAAFAERMNLYARAMGLRNTSFRNAHGLTATGPHLDRARHGDDRPAADLRFPAVLQHLQPQLDLGRHRHGPEHQPPAARRLSRRRRDQDRLHPGGGLQPRLLGAARQQAGDRRDDGRQDQRLAQRRGGAADGPRLRQDAGAGADRGAAAARHGAGGDAPRRPAARRRRWPRPVGLEQGAEVALVASGRPMPRALGGSGIARSTARASPRRSPR